MVVRVGFEPTYATRADLQSAAFNHSATSPDCLLRHFSLQNFLQNSGKKNNVMRIKKARRICQQRSHLMTPKIAKKRPNHQNTPSKRSQKASGRAGQGGNRPTRRDERHRDANPPAAAPRPPKNGLFIWGRHAVLAAIANSDRRIATIYATEDGAEELRGVIAGLDAERRAELPDISLTDRRRLDSVNTDNQGAGEKAVHQGMVVACWPLDPPALEDFLAATMDAPMRLLMLDQLSDPRNVGAIMRSARAFGVSAIITTHRHAPEENGGLARTATGALEHIPLIRVVNLSRAIETLQDAHIVVAGLAGEGTMDVGMLASFERLAIIMGAEGPGLRRLTRDHCDHLVRIPIDDAADSLNVSNAAAVALYAAGLPKQA